MTEREIANILDKATELKVEKRLKSESLALQKKELHVKEKELDNCRKARSFVQIVAEETQKKIEFQISNLVTTALAAVFPDPYEFVARFVQKRNRTECDLLLIKNGKECDPLSSTGGGVVDVAGFALRVAIWALKKTRAVFILDEPFKFVSVDLQTKCSLMLKEISEKLKVQILMVSHLPNIINSADKVFQIENIKGEAIVKET